ncbi:MAG TPA: exosortase/archaeosortase family protein [Ferruginibacter sp.]|jgi:exosortase/archaeosortase family protein|nr:exosortase/archaeosortase family protein [Ferruginibacter sp.]
MFFNKFLIQYLLKFLACFCLLYYGTLAIIGLAAPGGYYSPFIHNYLDYVSWLRTALLYCSKVVLTIFGYNVFIDGAYIIRIHEGAAVRLVYSCIGFGVMSFWTAFIFANKVRWQKKTKWIIAGLAMIFLINVARISLLLVAVNENWPNVWNLNNHTLFNIAAYILIFTMIYLFDRSEKNNEADVSKLRDK